MLKEQRSKKIDKNEQAIEAFKKAVTINPKFFESYGRMANLYNKLGQYEKALEAAQNSLKAKPNYPLGAFEAGTALKSMGKPQEAIKYFEIALKDRQWAQAAQYEIDRIKKGR